MLVSCFVELPSVSLSLRTSSPELSSTLLFSCLASTPALILLPLAAALEGLLLHAKQLRTIALAYLASLPVPLAILLYCRFQDSLRALPNQSLVPEEKTEWSYAKAGAVTHSMSAAEVSGADRPSYAAAAVWLLPLIYNLGRASVFGRVWSRARHYKGENKEEVVEQEPEKRVRGGDISVQLPAQPRHVPS